MSKWRSESHLVVSDSATPWTIQSMEFSRPEYWSGSPFPSPGGSSQPKDQTQVSHIAGRFFTSWATREAPRILEWVAYSLLQWVFLTQKPNQGLLHGRPILYQLRYQGSLSDNHCSILCIYVFVFCFIWLIILGFFLFFTFFICGKSYSICLSPSDLFHVA